jgi:hypothetical protein
MENAMVRRRPLGVSIISVILAIQGIFELLLGIFAILAIFAIGHAISGSGHTTTGTVVDVLQRFAEVLNPHNVYWWTKWSISCISQYFWQSL